EGVEHIIAIAAGQQKSDRHRGEERANSADAEIPAHCSCPQVGGIKLAGVNTAWSEYAGVDPADARDRHIHPESGRLGKPQMESRADKEISGQDRTASKSVYEPAAHDVAKKSANA